MPFRWFFAYANRETMITGYYISNNQKTSSFIFKSIVPRLLLIDVLFYKSKLLNAIWNLVMSSMSMLNLARNLIYYFHWCSCTKCILVKRWNVANHVIAELFIAILRIINMHALRSSAISSTYCALSSISYAIFDFGKRLFWMYHFDMMLVIPIKQ